MAAGGILNMGLFLKVAAAFLAAMLAANGIALNVNVLMVSLIAIAVLYTCYGGMRSVIITDVFQFVLLGAGLIAAIVYMSGIVPLDKAIEIITESKGQAGFDPLANTNFGPGYALWMVLVAGVVSAAIWPTALSRALCIEKEETVQRAYLVASVIFLSRMVLPAFLGVLAFCYFTGVNADLISGYGSDADLVAMPVMLGHALPKLAVGVFGCRYVCVVHVDPGQLPVLLVEYHCPRHYRADHGQNRRCGFSNQGDPYRHIYHRAL